MGGGGRGGEGAGEGRGTGRGGGRGEEGVGVLDLFCVLLLQ